MIHSYNNGRCAVCNRYVSVSDSIRCRSYKFTKGSGNDITRYSLCESCLKEAVTKYIIVNKGEEVFNDQSGICCSHV